VKLREFGLLTDENIDPVVLSHLRTIGFDVLDVCESGLQDPAMLTCSVEPWESVGSW
jgi:hypothetical protein